MRGGLSVIAGSAPTWQRVLTADLTSIAGGPLVDGQVLDAGGQAVTFHRSGASLVATPQVGYVECTRSGAGSDAGFFVVDLDSWQDECPMAVLASCSVVTLGASANVGGWIGRIQAGPAFGPSWQANKRTADFSARIGGNADNQLASVTGGSSPSAPLRSGALWVPRVGVVGIAAAGAELPPADPTEGVSYGPAAATSLFQDLSAPNRIGVSIFFPAASTVRIERFAVYRAVPR